MQNLFQLRYFRYLFEHLHFHTALIVLLLLWELMYNTCISKLQLFVRSIVCSCLIVGRWKQFDRDSKHSFSVQSYSWTLHVHQGAHPNTANNGTSSRLKALLQSVVQNEIMNYIDLHVVARRLPKSSTRKLRLSMGASRREVIPF